MNKDVSDVFRIVQDERLLTNAYASDITTFLRGQQKPEPILHESRKMAQEWKAGRCLDRL